MGFLFILLCIIFTVYGQLILKWRINLQPEMPTNFLDKAFTLVKLIIFDPYVLSGFVAAFVASIFWMAAMTKFSLSFAYPFMGLAFILVMVLSAAFFGEQLNLYKVIGTLLVVSGIIVMSQGYAK